MIVRTVQTSYENNEIIRREADCVFVLDTDERELQLVNIYPDIHYQTFEGFGGAITEAAGFVLNRLPEGLAKEAIESYFGPSGIGYRMIRTHLDSCDFSLGPYSAADRGDASFSAFSLARDETYILPYIRMAYQSAGEDLPVMLSPWSPPAGMKTNASRNGGGRLKPEYYGVWALYICKYVEEYRKRGIHIAALSVQNEPNAVQTWDSCQYSAQEERDFLANHLAPALQEAGLQAELYIWDHNKERLFERARDEIDERTSPLISGLAFHWYSGDHFEALRLVREGFPDKKLLFTEGCIEYSHYSRETQLQNAQMYAHDIIGNLNAGMNGFIDWNIVLDQDGGPNYAGNYCEAPIMCDTRKGTLTKKLSYYYIAHFSRYIQPGAQRIATTQYTPKLEITALQNPDSSIALVLLNRTNEDLPACLRLKNNLLELCIRRESICTALIAPQG